MEDIDKSIREIEVEASSPQEAIEIALKKLGVKRNEVEIKILNEETKGLFGMEGSKPAKVKVRVKERK
ncbi:MAG: Jag N-terminal domain-containing protein [Candidatus Omnitrophica bacterium]|nr:Jag N-terminal domain-containing protein [Candidatus Omnitrophota bacterium]